MKNKYYLAKSNRKNKKYMAINLQTNNKIHFGDNRYSDFLEHNNISKKKAYIARHKALNEHYNKDWSKKYINTPSLWSRYILWEKENLDDAIKNMEKKFNIIILRND